VKDLHNKLTALARQMDHHPAEPAMRERFVQALDQQIHVELGQKGFTALSKTLDELVAAAIEAEQSIAYVDLILGQVKEQPSSKYAKCTYMPNYQNKSAKTDPVTTKLSDKKVFIQEKPNVSTSKSTASTAKLQVYKPTNDSPKKDNPSNSNCNKCSKPGHWSQECPTRTVAAKSVEVYSTVTHYRSADPHHSEPETSLENRVHCETEIDESAKDKLSDDSHFMEKNEYDSASSDKGPLVVHAGFANISTEIDISAFNVEPLYNSKVSQKSCDLNQPTCEKELQEPISLFVKINGIVAYALLDSGCTTDMISAEFARVALVQPLKLAEPVQIQMACVGSCSTINYGRRAPVELGSIREERYFDIVNVDRYNIVFRTPFLQTHKVSLDFANKGVVIVDGVKLEKGTCPYQSSQNHDQRAKCPSKALKHKKYAIALPEQLAMVTNSSRDS
jgi:hypothetical protein